MQHKTAWNFAPAGSNRLRELLKLHACADLVAPVDEDLVAPVDEDAFGKKAGELLTRVAFDKRAGWLVTPVVSGEQHVPRAALQIDRVRPGAPPLSEYGPTHAHR
jgi:hypothetical protein